MLSALARLSKFVRGVLCLFCFKKHIQIRRISKPEKIRDKTLRDRAELSAAKLPAKNLTQFVATYDGEEAGYASFERRADQSCGVIYEVFVLSECRRKRVGGALIDFAETLARRLGCARTLVHPKPLDESIDQQWLEQWYMSKGYVRRNDGMGEYEKALN